MRRGLCPLTCVLALAGCNDHRFGFFPDTESDGGSSDPGTSVTTTESLPTTLSPTTVSPTTVQPTTPTTGVTITTEPPTTVTTVDPTGGTECGEVVLESSVPLQAFGTLQGQGDAFSLTCGGVGGSDLGLLWTAPFSGRFQFDTIGSNFDSLLAVLDGACFGKELACDDDSGGDLTSRVEVDLFAGQTVTVVVDSFGQSAGEVALHITDVSAPDECPDALFEAIVPLSIDGQTLGAPNARAGSCAGGDAPEIEAMWTAPFDGLFTFRVIEADFDPAIYLLAAACDGPEIACNDDSDGLNPAVSTPLVGGQPVIVVVDGVAGTAGKFVMQIVEG